MLIEFQQDDKFPEIRQPERKPEPIDPETEQIVLDSYFENNRGPVHLEKKIEDLHGNYIPHNRIYRVLLSHGLVEVNMKNDSNGSTSVMNELIRCRYGKETGRSLKLMEQRGGLLRSSMIHLGLSHDMVSLILPLLRIPSPSLFRVSLSMELRARS